MHVPVNPEEGEQRFEKELADTLTPDRIYDRAWADALLRRAMGALERDYQLAGKSAQYAAMEDCLAGSIEVSSYAQLGAALGLTVPAVKNAVYRMRLRYRDLVRTKIARTVASAADVDDELKSVFAALSC